MASISFPTSKPETLPPPSPLLDELFSAIQENDSSKVQKLIDQGVNLRTPNRDGNGPLCLAIRGKKPEIAHLLVQNGADPNEKMDPPYHNTPFQLIADLWRENLPLDLLNTLCEKGADINARNAFQQTPLMIAAISGNQEMISFLTQKGADLHLIDSNGCTVLHALASSRAFHIGPARNVVESARILLEKGADPNVRDRSHSTPLFSIFYSKVLFYSAPGFSHFLNVMNTQEELDFISLFLQHGANLHAQNEQGDTLLHWAGWVGDYETVLLLLKNGANPEIANAKGEKAIESVRKRRDNLDQTFLHLAALKGHTDIISLLLKHGADPNVTNKRGETPAHYAAVKGQVEALLTLLGKKQ